MELFRKIFGIKTEAEKKRLKEEWDEMALGLINKVSGLTRPAVHLLNTSNKTNSKFGGKPKVDGSDFVWPQSGERLMTFLAQLDLNEIAEQLEFEWLPKNGSLLFFYDIIEMPWGYDPKDRGKWKVFYQENPAIEIDHPADYEVKTRIGEQYIKAVRIDLLPSFEDPVIENLNLTDEETDLYIEIEEHFEEFNAHSDLPAHQVGGIALPVQGDEMEFEAEHASNGVYMGDAKAYERATKEDFYAAKDKWKLLLQFDSDEQINAIWGDLGMLYFWVEAEKSKVKNFSDTWLVLQCS